MTVTFVDARIVSTDKGTGVQGAVAQSANDMYILNQLTVGPDFDGGQFTPGQKVRIFFEGLRDDDQPKIKSVSSLS